jgi:ABC-type transport system involved in multi-copper enzyme maturation permease subunit
MLRFFSADWFRIRRFWLPWVLLGILVISVALQVNGKIERLRELEAELAAVPAVTEPATPSELAVLQSVQDETAWLRERLCYPAFIGYAVRLATDSGWFLLILLTAVVGGEDFARRTLHSILALGTGRGRYLVTRCLTLWLAAGAGILVVTLLATAGGLYVHPQVTDDPISLEGLGQPLLVVGRAWVACLPFIVATLFWAVLARRAGPAMGVGIAVRSLEFLLGFIAPIFEILIAAGAEVPLFFRLEVGLYTVSLGYSAEAFLNWGAPFTDVISSASSMGLDTTLLPDRPWRAVAFMTGYTILFLGWAWWILHRRDVTTGT